MSLKPRPIQRKTGSRRLKIGSGRIKPKKVPKGTDAWIKAIPRGKHGSGHLQQRLWRLKSDFCRIRDFIAWGPKCVATGITLNGWNGGQGGHFKSWQKCNGMFKFHEMNIHLQSAQSNAWGDKDDWKYFENELIRRYGQEFVDAIETTNANWPLKITNDLVLKEMKRTLTMLGMMAIKPDYYDRVQSLLPTSV